MRLVMCPKCGFKVSDEYSTCFVCGNVLKRGAVTLNAPRKVIITEDSNKADDGFPGSKKVGRADDAEGKKDEAMMPEAKSRVSDETSEIGKFFGEIERETVKPIFRSIDESV